MTTPYTPKVGDILTGVDARGVRGPVEVVAERERGSFSFVAKFPHVPGGMYRGDRFPKDTCWCAQPDGSCNNLDFRVLFEPWQEPAGEPTPFVSWAVRDAASKDADAAATRQAMDRAGLTPKLTTIGKLAEQGVKPGTVVAVHLVVESTHDDDDIQPICLQTPDGDDFWPHRDTPCTIISEPEPEPWSPEPGKPALFLGHDVTIVAIDQASDEAWVRGGGVNGAVPLAELERPQ